MSEEKQVSKSRMTEGAGEQREPDGGGARLAIAGSSQSRGVPAGGSAATAGGPQRSAVEPGETARSVGPPAVAAAAVPGPSGKMSVPDPEVVPKASRRRFKTEYKVKILREADACTDPGQIGALLRREGLYSSHLTVWRRLRDQGFLVFAGERKRGRKAKPADPQAKRVAELERENRQLSEKLRKAEIIIDFQKKVQDLLRMHDQGAPK